MVASNSDLSFISYGQRIHASLLLDGDRVPHAQDLLTYRLVVAVPLPGSPDLIYLVPCMLIFP